MSFLHLQPINLINESGKRRKKLWRNNLILFFALIILIFIAPVLENQSILITRVSLVVTVISGIFAAEFEKKVFKLLITLGIMVLTLVLCAVIFSEAKIFNILSFVLMMTSIILSTIALIAHMSQSESASKSTILCAINSYLMLGLIASVMFIILDLFVPHSFMNLESAQENIGEYIYFGFVNLTTLGYGDIVPIAPLARSLTTLVAVGGQLYLVIIMALIIGKFLNSKK